MSGAVAADDGISGVSSDTERTQELYQSLSRVSILERKTFYESLPAASKAGLWRVHLQVFAREHPELTNEQRAVLESAEKLLELAFSDNDRSNSGTADLDDKLDDLKRRARAVFPSAMAIQAFTRLGADAIVTLEAAAYATPTECECSVRDDWCGWGSACRYPHPTACTTVRGCGWYWLEICDGMCQDK
ncbi:MAG TPA: bacteriocin fulvocin C-related protein [Thermoanaerobaculia bacterium]|nr:bacteriocin fulvocin C-related protein [Thermoanaerobaculia bacterium]